MSIDWQNVFHFTVSPLELFIRGSLTYWFIFVLLRIAGRRDIGSLGMADMIVLVLIADAAQNAMAGEYKSVSDGMVLISTIVGWTVAVDRIGYLVPPLQRLLEADTICLVRDGVLIARNLRREYITKDELLSKLREKGVSDLAEVRRAYIEPGGSISVLMVRRRPPRVDTSR